MTSVVTSSYFCYRCETIVPVEEDFFGLKCEICGETFVEEVANQPTILTVDGEDIDMSDDEDYTSIDDDDSEGMETDSDDPDEDGDDSDSDVSDSTDDQNEASPGTSIAFLINSSTQTALTQHKGLRSEDIGRLPMVKVSRAHTKNGTQCATCMESFKIGEKVGKLNCEHIYHRPCIEPWLRKRKTCPVCRKVVDPGEWKN